MIPVSTWNTEKDYVLFWSEATDGRMNFIFSGASTLERAIARAADSCADGGRIRVYERCACYEVKNGRRYGI